MRYTVTLNKFIQFYSTMITSFVSKVILSLVLFALMSSEATSAPSSNKDAKIKIISVFSVKYGQIPTEVIATPLPGIFQIISNGQISYMDVTGKYLINGDIVDVATGVSLNESQMTKIALKFLKTIDTRDAVKIVQGKGTRIIYSFEDTNCGYCKKLSSEFEKLNDVTIYTFMVQFLGEDSGEKAKKVWCSPDRAATWKAYMSTTGSLLPSNLTTTCDTSFLDRNFALSRKLGITGTPTMFFANGEKITGYSSADLIEKQLMFKK